MDKLKDNYLDFHPDTLVMVRKAYNLDQPGRMDEAIDILEEWLKKQDHFLKKDFSRDYLERQIINNKGLLERTKIKLDKLCTLRTMMPEFFTPGNVIDFQNINGCLVDAFMPKLTENQERIYILKADVSKPTPEIFTNFYKRTLVYWEYLHANDYSLGYHDILDFRNTNIMDILTVLNLVEAHRFATLGGDGYSFRSKGFHIITSSKFADTLISLFKKVMPVKFHSKIKHYVDLESLHENIPKKLLPIEYGGNEKSIYLLSEDFHNTISSQKNVNYIEDIYKARTDESMRSADKFNEQHLGTPGSFRTMVVD